MTLDVSQQRTVILGDQKKKKKGDSPMSSFPAFTEFSCCGTSKGYLGVLSKLRKQSLGSKKILSN